MPTVRFESSDGSRQVTADAPNGGALADLCDDHAAPMLETCDELRNCDYRVFLVKRRCAVEVGTVRAHHLIKEYSLGMKKKTGLLAALAGDPRVLVLDEPLNALDAHSMRLVERQTAAQVHTSSSLPSMS